MEKNIHNILNKVSREIFGSTRWGTGKSSCLVLSTTLGSAHAVGTQQSCHVGPEGAECLEDTLYGGAMQVCHSIFGNKKAKNTPTMEWPP